MRDIVQVTVYVRDIGAFESVSDIRESYFPENGPASAIVEVSALAWPEFLIEIAAVAAPLTEVAGEDGRPGNGGCAYWSSRMTPGLPPTSSG